MLYDLLLNGRNPREVYEIQELAGRGTFGEVFRAVEKETKELRALKVVKIEDLQGIQDITNEISIMEKVKHPNVVRYYETMALDENKILIAMELCEAGSLYNLYEKTKIPLDEQQISFVMREALKGISYLHENKVIHRDIKAGNLLITANGDIKLADFGVSASLKMTFDNRKTAIGSPYWMAPEVIQQEEYSFQADIWSLGITAIELLDGKPPLSDIHAFRAIFLIPNRPPPEPRMKIRLRI
ncbi:MAG: putative Serine/threonine-protein kinase [Streblomastix strix]|uniref:Putative Serine/threonine-protein kinase n=1 Tax=Streblomastix strix TaxID=222440 RepID=A0A5J4UT22_9EUKA|nr:MAG: putative Serine/threonine-protein kinase [Streblomastix strix]